MLALSIREPWIYAILHLRKNVENRTWPTKVRGRILLHASKQFDYDGYRWIENEMGYILPEKDMFELGGIVGSVEITDCIKYHDSGKKIPSWFFGPYGFILKDPELINFILYKGQLGFFEVHI
jgi:hypothetical protein